MILTIPVNAAIASYNKKLQTKQMMFKDSRIKIVNEVLNGIKVISVSLETALVKLQSITVRNTFVYMYVHCSSKFWPTYHHVMNSVAGLFGE